MAQSHRLIEDQDFSQNEIQVQGVHFQQGNETNMPLMRKIGHFGGQYVKFESFWSKYRVSIGGPPYCPKARWSEGPVVWRPISPKAR